MKIRVADYVARWITYKCIKDVFMLSGGGIMHLTDGLACNPSINVICMHHEQAVSMAVEAYAKHNNHFAVGYFTTGPGATNAITGLAGAWLDSVPCMFISGQAKNSEAVFNKKIEGLRQVGVQEINILPIVDSITKYSAFVKKPEDIGYHLDKAYYLARSGRPGPVWIDIPSDVQSAYVNDKKLRKFIPPKKAKEKKVSINNYFAKAKRPVILAGYGVRLSYAMSELGFFAERHNIPVVTTYLGADVIGFNHPNYVGRVGIKGDRAGNLAIQTSDLLLVIGASLPIAETGYNYKAFAPNAKKIVVDVDMTSHKKGTVKFDKYIKQDAHEFLTNLKAPVFKKDWLNKCIAWRNKYPVCLPEYSKTKGKINIYYFIDCLCKQLTGHDTVVTDAGSAFFAGSQAVRIKKGVSNTGMRYITSGGFATMGYSIPASIGACISTPLTDRIMCITGDGSFQQNLQELQTIVHHNLPIKIFVLNNNGYLSIRTTQEKFCENRMIGEGPDSGVSFPSTEKIAKAYGIDFIKVSDSKTLSSMLNDVIRRPGAVICEVMTPEKQLIIPTVASVKREDGRMESRGLEDMFPFLSREELEENLS